MNERIRELLIEAHKQTKGGIYNGHPSEWTEKFAELLVQSIIDLLEKDRENYDNPGMYRPSDYYDSMEAKETAISDAIDSIKYTYLREE